MRRVTSLRSLGGSSPAQFLLHPQPLMFVAGLSTDISRDAGPVVGGRTAAHRERSSTIASTSSLIADTAGPSERRPSDALLADNENRDRSGSQSKITPVPSPTAPQETAVPQSQSAEDSEEKELLSQPGAMVDEKQAEINERDKEFDGLMRDLRGALEHQSEKGRVWLPETERRSFRIMLVEKSVRLPLRKIAPSGKLNETPRAGIVPHSPLSPYTPSSPMYPDGLIAPIWIRKHTEFVPCVFVLFLRLYESPLSYDDEKASDADKTAEKTREKDADDALVREIGERRRRLGERGIKLTVVLMASTETLDSPELDSRLSFIRRSSALASKASLFVLTPVPADQLDEFVQSLQDALYEPAMEYYFAHTKRVRRKKSRINASQAGTVGADGKTRGLGGAGWTVRYDWKLGWFAEIRGEYVEARRHYEDCWNELARMFTSTTTLPPRTKRWAEAKVLADCLATRICRLFLYDADPQRVLTPFYVHLKRFGDFSRGWGIGDDTFEFWSWVARQYRVLAELLELSMEHGVTVPSGPFPAFPASAPAGMPPDPAFFATPTSSVNPMFVLQHAAFYYYTAACCSVARKERYDIAVKNDERGSTKQADRAGVISPAPGFAYEEKVDHAALIVELFTKAYTLLKDRPADLAQDRLALMVAFRIGETYGRSGQTEMAMRFLDRISPTFKRSRWTHIVSQIRELWYSSARQVGNVDVVATLLLEMLGADELVLDQSRQYIDEFLGLLGTTKPSCSDPIVIEIGSEDGLLRVSAGFHQGEANPDEAVAFQLVLTCPANRDIANLPISACEIKFTDGTAILIAHSDDVTETAIDLGSIDSMQGDSAKTANLRWQPGQARVINGTVQCRLEQLRECSSVRLFIRQNEWDIEIPLFPRPLEIWMTLEGPIESIHEPSTTLAAVVVPLQVSSDINHLPSAYVGEAFPIMITIRNNDTRQIRFHLSAVVQAEDNEPGLTLRLGDEVAESSEQSIELGLVPPGTSVDKTLHMRGPREGNAILELDLRSALVDASEEDYEEQRQTMVIPILPPFQALSSVQSRPAVMTTDSRKERGRAAIVSVLNLSDTGPLVLHDMSLENGESERTRLVSSTVQHLDKTSFPQTWDEMTLYSVSSIFAIYASSPHTYSNDSPEPTSIVISWSRPSTTSERYTARVQLPPLAMPARDSFISALQTHPSSVRAHEPFEVSLVVQNDRPTPAADLALQVETSDPFVWLGGRSQVLAPPLQSGEARELRFKLLPVGGTGRFALPNVRLWEGEAEEKEEVSIPLAKGGPARGASVFVMP